MSLMQEEVTLHGSCDCKRVGIEFTTRREPRTTAPRACDCSFCMKHGAAYVSDPAGQLRITSSTPSVLRSYRQGSGAAEFRLCSECGVLVAVTFEHDSRLYGAVNATCLDDALEFEASIPASPQALSPEQKVARWLQTWVPDAQLSLAGT